MSEKTYSDIETVLQEDFGISSNRITRETKLIEDLGFDSLDLVELAMGVEDAENLPVNSLDDDMVRLKWSKSSYSIGGLEEIVDQALENRGPA